MENGGYYNISDLSQYKNLDSQILHLNSKPTVKKPVCIFTSTGVSIVRMEIDYRAPCAHYPPIQWTRRTAESANTRVSERD